MPIEVLREQLEQCNHQLAEISGVEPVELHYQSGDSGKDALFLYGVIGGKDVGKTTLINQLAGSRISIDSNILDEGTKTAVAYCHQDDRTALHNRLGINESNQVLFIEHTRDELKNVVLLDFPDFDSRFEQHIDEVRRLSKFLQGMVWVTTPRKYGDHEFIHQFIAVAQSHDYYFVVLNKVDQIAKQAATDEIRGEIHQYLKLECEKAGVDVPASNRMFLISALHPAQFEFTQLQTRLVRVHSPEEIAKAKLKNLQSEFQKNIQHIQHYYRVEETVEAFEIMIEAIQRGIREAFSMKYAETVRDRVSSMESLQRRISSQLFGKRVKQLPLLWLVYYPLAGIIASISGWFSFQNREQRKYESAKEILRVGSATASSRLVKLINKLRSEHPHWSEQWDQIDLDHLNVHERFNQLLYEYEDLVTQHVISNQKPPSILTKFGVYFPLVWFPFLQPILFVLSQSDSSMLSLSSIWVILGLFLSLFSADALLVNLLFLIVFYIVWLGILYSFCVKWVQKEGEEEFSQLWHERFIPWIGNSLSQPLQSVRQHLLTQKIELERIEKEIRLKMQHIETP